MSFSKVNYLHVNLNTPVSYNYNQQLNISHRNHPLEFGFTNPFTGIVNLIICVVNIKTESKCYE